MHLEEGGRRRNALPRSCVAGWRKFNLQMAGPTLQAMCALLNQLREHAAWGDVPQVIEAGEVNQDLISESKKPLVH